MKSRLVLLLLILAAAVNVSIAAAQSAGTFTATGSMITPRSEHAATLLSNGMVLITGGQPDGLNFHPTNSAEIYDPSTGTFSATGQMTIARYSHTATLLPDGRVLIAGGGDANGRLGLTAELYDPSTGTFTATGSMTTGSFAVATLLSDGKVLIGAPSAELYDPATGTFTAAPGYPDGGYYSATVLPGGKVLIPVEPAAAVYDPATGTFSLTDTMINGHAPIGRSATLLMSGKVLFAGGELNDAAVLADGGQPPYYPYAELYDPSDGSFAATGNMTEARYGHTAILLPDGTVFIAGRDQNAEPDGTVFIGGPDQNAELYNPSTGAFGSIGNTIEPRLRFTSTLLRDGRVLIIGGLDYPGTFPFNTFASAELYTPALLLPAPALFSLSGDGRGQGAVWNGVTGQIASGDHPAAAGDVLSMYTISLFEGGVIPPQVAIGGKLAEILFFGGAPGYPGYFQVNFRVPSGVVPGSAITVRLTYIGRPSNAVTIGVQ